MVTSSRRFDWFERLADPEAVTSSQASCCTGVLGPSSTVRSSVTNSRRSYAAATQRSEGVGKGPDVSIG